MLTALSRLPPRDQRDEEEVVSLCWEGAVFQGFRVGVSRGLVTVALSGVAQELVLSATPGDHGFAQSVNDPIVQVTAMLYRDPEGSTCLWFCFRYGLFC